MSQTLEADANVVSRLIDRQVQANLGQQRALEYGDKHYSYYDVAALANRAGNLLKELGFGPGARVLLLMPPSPAFVGALLGAMKIGAVPVLARRPEHAQAAVALVHASELGKIGWGADKVVVVGEAPEGYRSFVELMRAQPSSLAAEPVSAAAPALVVEEEKAAATLSHGELQALIDGDGDGALGRTAQLLRVLAKGQTARLP